MSIDPNSLREFELMTPRAKLRVVMLGAKVAAEAAAFYGEYLSTAVAVSNTLLYDMKILPTPKILRLCLRMAGVLAEFSGSSYSSSEIRVTPEIFLPYGRRVRCTFPR